MIGVTGATGRLGGRVARLLADAGVEQRLIVRTPERAPDLPRATVVQASYDRAAESALEGVDVLLMVSASETPDRLTQHRDFVDAAAAAGVGHLVYISFAGASPTAMFTLARDHFHTERHIEASGIAHTFLRDCLYADFVPELAGPDGVIWGPAGEGRVAFVGQDDIAEAASAVLQDPAPHVGRTYTLTGPEALTLTEAARILSEVSGRSVSFQDETIEEAYASRAAYGAERWQLDAWVSTYTAMAAGEFAEVTDDIHRLTGHAPRTLADVLRDA